MEILSANALYVVPVAFFILTGWMYRQVTA
jgi:hypothetical protein